MSSNTCIKTLKLYRRGMQSKPALGRIHFSGSDIAANVTIKHKNKKTHS